jgi:hypothetical protein
MVREITFEEFRSEHYTDDMNTVRRWYEDYLNGEEEEDAHYGMYEEYLANEEGYLSDADTYVEDE